MYRCAFVAHFSRSFCCRSFHRLLIVYRRLAMANKLIENCLPRRFFAVLKPLNFKEHRGKIMIAIAWSVSALCSAPQVRYSFVYYNHHPTDYYRWCSSFNRLFASRGLTNDILINFHWISRSQWYFTSKLIQTLQTSHSVCHSMCSRQLKRWLNWIFNLNSLLKFL